LETAGAYFDRALVLTFDEASANSALSGAAISIYWRLIRYAGKDGKCYPQLKTLAATSGRSEPTARAAVAKLVDAGLVRLSKRGKRTQYNLIVPEHIQVIVDTEAEQAGQAPAEAESRKNLTSGTERNFSHYQKKQTDKEIKTKPNRQKSKMLQLPNLEIQPETKELFGIGGLRFLFDKAEITDARSLQWAIHNSHTTPVRFVAYLLDVSKAIPEKSYTALAIGAARKAGRAPAEWALEQVITLLKQERNTEQLGQNVPNVNVNEDLGTDRDRVINQYLAMDEADIMAAVIRAKAGVASGGVLARGAAIQLEILGEVVNRLESARLAG
jgi:hypothetical protein